MDTTTEYIQVPVPAELVPDVYKLVVDRAAAAGCTEDGASTRAWSRMMATLAMTRPSLA